MPYKFMVLDVETSGLCPQSDMLLEVCALCVEEGEVVGQFDAVVHRPRVVGTSEALRMHTTNGLLEECADPDRSLLLSVVSDTFSAWLHTHFGADEGPVLVAGKNVWKLDIPFLMVDLKLKAELFHHRALDPAGKLMRWSDDAPPGLVECARRVGLNVTKDDHRAETGAKLVLEVIKRAWAEKPGGNES